MIYLIYLIYLILYFYVYVKLISDNRSPTSRAEIQLENGNPDENNKSEPKRLESRNVSRETRCNPAASSDTNHQPIKLLYPVLDIVETTIVPQSCAEESLGHQLRESPQVRGVPLAPVSREDLVSRSETRDSNVVTVSKLCDDTAEDDSASASTLQHLTFKDAISTEIENGKSLKELKEPLLRTLLCHQSSSSCYLHWPRRRCKVIFRNDDVQCHFFNATEG